MNIQNHIIPVDTAEAGNSPHGPFAGGVSFHEKEAEEAAKCLGSGHYRSRNWRDVDFARRNLDMDQGSTSPSKRHPGELVLRRGKLPADPGLLRTNPFVPELRPVIGEQIGIPHLENAKVTVRWITAAVLRPSGSFGG